MPLTTIKDITKDIALSLIRKAPYNDFFDFISSTYEYKLNPKIIENLIYSGALDFFNETKQTLINNIKSANIYSELANELDKNLINKPVLEKFSEFDKPKSARFFADLGFYEIARLDGALVFMENRRSGFETFCSSLAATRREGAAAAIVMNANPFTLGHRYLVERALQEYSTVHIFVLSEDASHFPADVRYDLVREGVKDLPNIVLHRTGDYLISAATFPSYFLRDSESVIRASARLDLALFVKIAAAIGVTARFVGDEPTSVVTGLYNRIMAQELPKAGIRCVIVPRLEKDRRIVSASSVRQAIHDGSMQTAKAMLPPSTWRYLTSPEAVNVLRAIRASDEVVHY